MSDGMAFDPAFEKKARRAGYSVSWKCKKGERTFQEDREEHALQKARLRAAQAAMTPVYTHGATAQGILSLLPVYQGEEEGEGDDGSKVRRAHLETIASVLDRAMTGNPVLFAQSVDASRVRAVQAWRESDTADTRKAIIIACLELYQGREGDGPEHDGTWTDAGSTYATERLRRHERARRRLRAEDDRLREQAALLRLNR